MKLIDILVQELPKLGGWIKGHYQCAQDKNGEVCFYTKGKIHLAQYGMWSIPVDSEATHDGESRVVTSLADDYAETIITREQYEAALAGSKPEWDGEGLPPVGCECEALYDSGGGEWFLAKILAHDNDAVIGRWLEGAGVYSLLDYSSPHGSFRPIRSNADKKREEIILQMSHSLRANGSVTGDQLCRLYSDIAAGYIPHIRID